MESFKPAVPLYFERAVVDVEEQGKRHGGYGKPERSTPTQRGGASRETTGSRRRDQMDCGASAVSQHPS